jgi:hypothetical protein
MPEAYAEIGVPETVATKAEAMQDNFSDQGFKGLKISGQIDPTFIYNKRQKNETSDCR